MESENQKEPAVRRIAGYFLIVCITMVLTGGVVALLFNVYDRKAEEKISHVNVIELTEADSAPALWGRNYPREYDGYKKTSDIERTRYGGSEAFSKLDQDPVWKRFFAGYPFGVDYREERGHAYSLADQKETLRTQQYKQPGACLHCHAGGMKHVYEELGQGSLAAGFEKMNAMPLEEAWTHVTHPITCADCHDPKTMGLRVTRPGFLNGIKAYKESQGIQNYDPNTMATRQEMRTMVCAQCHVEYYFKGPEKQLTYPWSKGIKVEEIESYYNEVQHKDWIHAETGAPVLKAQHPEFELWSQGVHSKSGVSCADCHMPYKREGAAKVTDHHIRSPMLNTAKACLQCHHFTEQEMKDRVETIQTRTKVLMQRAEKALLALIDDMVKAKAGGTSDVDLADAAEMQRKAQWRLDFISAENSMGFHAPQEAARILAESIDYSRQGQVLVQKWLKTQ